MIWFRAARHHIPEKRNGFSRSSILMPFLESVQKLYWIFFSPPPPSPLSPTCTLPPTAANIFPWFPRPRISSSPSCAALSSPVWVGARRASWVEYESSSDSCEAAWKCHSRGRERSVGDKGGLGRGLPLVYLMFCQSHANLPWTLARDSVNNVLRLRYREHWSQDVFFFFCFFFKRRLLPFIHFVFFFF